MALASCSNTPNRIRFFRGDSHAIEVTVKKKDPTDPTGKRLVVVDLSGETVSALLTVKTRASDTTILIQKTGSLVNPPGADGKLKFKFEPVDTQDVQPGLYPYDVQVTLVNVTTRVYTLLKDLLEIREDVTP